MEFGELNIVIVGGEEDSWAIAHRLEADASSFAIAIVPKVAEAFGMFDGSVDVVLTISGAVGRDEFRQVMQEHPGTAVVVAVEEMSISLVEKFAEWGADDIVSRAQTSPMELARAVGFAAYKKRATVEAGRAAQRERKLADQQKRLLEVLDEIDVLIGTTDVAGSVSYMNQAARDFWLEGQVDYAATDLFEMVAPSSRTWLGEVVFAEFLESGRWTGNLTLRRFDGEPVEADVTMLMHRDEHDHPSFFAIGRLRSTTSAMERPGGAAEAQGGRPITESG